MMKNNRIYLCLISCPCKTCPQPSTAQHRACCRATQHAEFPTHASHIAARATTRERSWAMVSSVCGGRREGAVTSGWAAHGCPAHGPPTARTRSRARGGEQAGRSHIRVLFRLGWHSVASGRGPAMPDRGAQALWTWAAARHSGDAQARRPPRAEPWQLEGRPSRSQAGIVDRS